MKLPKNRTSADTLKEARANLNTLTRKIKTEYSSREAVAELETDIRAAMALDHTLIDIAEMLKELGLEIKPDTLGKLLHEFDAKSGIQKRRKNSRVVAPVSDRPVLASRPAASPVVASAPQAPVTSRTDGLDAEAHDKLLEDLDIPNPA